MFERKLIWSVPKKILLQRMFAPIWKFTLVVRFWGGELSGSGLWGFCQGSNSSPSSSSRWNWKVKRLPTLQSSILRKSLRVLKDGWRGSVCIRKWLREEGVVAYPDTFPATACLPGVVDKETTQDHYQGHLWHSAFRFYIIEVKRQIVRGPAEYDRVCQS